MIDLTQTPKRLKQSILMEAMQGKLTKQLPGDGNASDLVDFVHDEKVKLVKDGKLRKRRKLPPLTKERLPFSIPNSWKWVRLGYIFDISSASRVHKSEWKSSGIPFYRAREVVSLSKDEPLKDPIFISEKTYRDKISRSGKPCKGDMLFTGVGTLGTSWIIPNNNKFYYKDASVLCLHNISNINIHYINMFFKSSLFHDQVRKDSRGTAVKTLTITNSSKLIIPLPPLAEQKRIVQRLDQILPKIDGLNKDVVRLHSIRKAFPHRLKQSLLMEAMQGKLTKQLPSDGDADELLQKIQQKKQALIKAGKIRRHKKLPSISRDEIPFKIPKNWKWVRLGDISDYIQRGKSPEYGKDGIPVVSQKCVRWNRIDLTRAKIIKKSSIPRYKKIRFLKPYDLLWNSTGTGTIGRATLVKPCILKRFNKLVVDGHVTIVRINTINPEFLYLFIKSNIVQNIIDDIASGSTKQIELGKKAIENLLIPLPPLSEQKRILNALENAFTRID